MTTLSRDSIGWRGQFFQAMAHMAPAIGVAMNAQFIASRAGAAMPLASAFGMVLALLLAYCLALLTRLYYGASGYFQIHSRALGSGVGFVTSWLFLMYEPLNAFFNLFGYGVLILGPFSKANFGFEIPWWGCVAAGSLIVTVLSASNVKSSIRTTALLGMFEVIVFTAMGALLLWKSDNAFHPAYFTPAASAEGGGGLLFGFIFSFMAFVGYESGLPLTEETRDAKSTMFKGIMTSVLLAGIFYVFVNYATVVGFGGGDDPAGFAKAFSGAENPYGSTLAVKAFGAFGVWLVFFATLNSAIACGLAGQNAAARVFFALGRAGIMPRALGVADPKTGSPKRASYFATVITFIAIPVFLFLVGKGNAMDWFGMAGVAIVLALLVIHLMTCVSVFIAYRREEGHDFHAIHHGVIPVITGLLVLLPIWGAVHYNPDPPMSYAPWIVLAWFVVGLFVYAWLRANRPATLKALESEMEKLEHQGTHA